MISVLLECVRPVKMSYYVLIPCMAFYKICVGVRLEQLLDAWPFFLYPTLFACCGFLVGIVLNRFLQIQSKPLRHSIVITLMFGNFGNLPFSLLETITKDVSPFSEDPVSLPRSLAYASIFLSTASLWLWSFGPWYIRNSRTEVSSPATADRKSARDDENQTPLDEMASSSSSDDATDSAPSTMPSASSSSYPSQHNVESIHLSEMDDSSPPSSSSPSVSVPFPTLPSQQPLHRRAMFQLSALVFKASALPIWGIITPSTIACILAVIILAVGPVHRLMFVPVSLSTSSSSSSSSSSSLTPSVKSNSTTPSFNTTPIQTDTNADGVCLSSSSSSSSKPPLQFVADSIGSLANICVPISLLLLGSNLYSTVKTQWARARLQSQSSSPKQSILPLSKRVLFGAVFTRLVVLPVLFFCLTWIISKLGILPADPLVTIILVLESCMPSAINLIILAQLQDDQLVVEQLSTILLAQYLFCTITIFTCISLGIELFL